MDTTERYNFPNTIEEKIAIAKDALITPHYQHIYLDKGVRFLSGEPSETTIFGIRIITGHKLHSDNIWQTHEK